MEITFCLFLWGLWLYSNTWNAGYVWDDRAAIVNNYDVHQTRTSVMATTSSGDGDDLSTSTSQMEYDEITMNITNKGNYSSFYDTLAIFSHDFWGQDITLEFSHKSYRPLTTLSYRLNYLISGINPRGFHIGNILIYGVCCVIYYWMISRWVSSQTAIVASILYSCHPIHVEAVASLVGRADSLCGVFYFLAILCYSDSLPLTKSPDTSHRIRGALMSFLAFIFALFASFTKEIGLTVFGIFVVLEYMFYHLHERVSHSPSFALTSGWFREWNLLMSPRKNKDIKMRSVFYSYFASLKSFFLSIIESPITFPTVRVVTSLIIISCILYFRSLLHGNYQLYPWTLMENHISLEPSFLTRALSYGHTHYLYGLKLFNPITPHLCFDYGFPCLPTITTLSSPLNILTFVTYFTIAHLILYSLIHSRLILLFSLVLILFPLLPALNILFPVGTILAERLCFIPSCGATLLMAELYTHEFRWLWSPKSSGSHPQYSTIPASRSLIPLVPIFFLLFPLTPMIGVMTYHVRQRNLDWNNETSIYESSLAVCPDNIRALNNVAMLKSSEGKASEAAEHLERSIYISPSSDTCHYRALELYPFQISTYINSGVSYATLHNYPKAIYRLQQGLSLRLPGTSSISTAAYLGVYHSQFYYQMTSPTADRRSSTTLQHLIALLLTSRNYLNLSTTTWDTPMGYFATANAELELFSLVQRGYLSPSAVSLDEKKIEFNILHAIELNEKLDQLYQQGVPVQDTIDTYSAYNQLGLYYLSLYDRSRLRPYGAMSRESFLKGIALQPLRLESKINLATLYGSMSQDQEAVELLLNLVHDLDSQGISPPSYLFQNLGNAQEKLQQYAEAKRSYERALEIIESSNSGGGEELGISHPSSEKLRQNIERLGLL